MPIKVYTYPAKIKDTDSTYLKLALDIANARIEEMADDYRNSPVNDLDPKDGREFLIALKVNTKSGSIDTILDYKAPTEFQKKNQ